MCECSCIKRLCGRFLNAPGIKFFSHLAFHTIYLRAPPSNNFKMSTLFNLRKFISNDLGLQARIDGPECNFTSVSSPVEKRVKLMRKTMLKGSQEGARGEVKVLGVLWRVSSDKLVLDLSAVTKAAKEYSQPTKRQINSIVSKIYDPLGIQSPL